MPQRLDYLDATCPVCGGIAFIGSSTRFGLSRKRGPTQHPRHCRHCRTSLRVARLERSREDGTTHILSLDRWVVEIWTATEQVDGALCDSTAEARAHAWGYLTQGFFVRATLHE